MCNVPQEMHRTPRVRGPSRERCVTGKHDGVEAPSVLLSSSYLDSCCLHSPGVPEVMQWLNRPKQT